MAIKITQIITSFQRYGQFIIHYRLNFQPSTQMNQEEIYVVPQHFTFLGRCRVVDYALLILVLL